MREVLSKGPRRRFSTFTEKANKSFNVSGLGFRGSISNSAGSPAECDKLDISKGQPYEAAEEGKVAVDVVGRSVRFPSKTED